MTFVNQNAYKIHNHFGNNNNNNNNQNNNMYSFSHGIRGSVKASKRISCMYSYCTNVVCRNVYIAVECLRRIPNGGGKWKVAAAARPDKTCG